MLVLDDELAKAAEISESGLKLEIAILLFQKNKITSRKAAKLAGINFLEFWKELSKRNMDLIGEKT
jgi:predicted HTH domain antitoxin